MTLSSRRGIVLVVVLALLALFGLLLAGAVAAEATAQRAQRASTADDDLLAAAELALGDVLSNAPAYRLDSLSLGQPATFGVTVPGSLHVSVRVTATRLRNAFYWIVADAQRDDGELARRRVQRLARSLLVTATPSASIIARAPATIAPTVVLSADSSGDADCALLATTLPLVTGDSSTLVEGVGQLDSLAASPGVLHVAGDTTLAGSGAYQGILIGDGRVIIDGPFTFSGLLIARGAVRMRNGATLIGTLISQASGPDPPIDIADATVRHAPCVVAATLRRVARIRAIRDRGWFEIF